MIKYRFKIQYFAPILLLFFLCSYVGASTTSGSGTAIWTWAEISGSEHAIFISRQVGEGWEEPQKISANEGINIVPAVIPTAAKDLMVVWSTFTGGKAQLRYRQLKNGVWTEEKEYYTGLSSNMAPSIAVDGSGKIWMVWAGFNGISDEIYFTTWNGTSFATAQAMTANGVPDIQPVLGIDETTGTPRVQWQQYSESGYVKYESSWNGSAWGEPVLLSAADTAAAATEKTTAAKRALKVKRVFFTGNNASSSEQSAKAKETGEDLDIEIPEFIASPDSASIHIPGHGVQSLPIRSVILIK